jgi:hypothetical protein
MVSLLMLCAARSAKNHRGGSVLWTPANLATPPLMWLTNLSTISTDVNGHCSQWNDYSGNGNFFTQNTLARNPGINSSGQNGLRVLTFNGATNQALGGSGISVLSLTQNISACSIFVAGNPTKNSSGTLQTIWYASVGTSGNVRCGILIASNQVQAYQRRLDADTVASAVITQPDSNWHLMQSEHNWAAQSVAIRLDGGTPVTTTTTQGSGNTANTPSTAVSLMANLVSGNGWATGNIGEVIFLNYILTTTDRQKIEGYVAWKWGLEANLPSGHPYKTAPPYV